MPRPLALDLYCKAGGSARGLVAAGFDVVGIDIEAQPNYPYRFLRADALHVLKSLLAGGPIDAGHRDGRWHFWLRDFSYIWASPPCLDNTSLRSAPGAKRHKDLIAPTRRLLQQTGLPWTIENVESPRARKRLRDPFRLCGTMFGLGVTIEVDNEFAPLGYIQKRYELRRHRLFETNFEVPPSICQHTKLPVIGIYGAHCRCRSRKHGGRGTADFVGYSHNDLASGALGIPPGEMTLDELSNAIPPAYAKWIGENALKEIDRRRLTDRKRRA